jgi:hypothetical protein
MFGIIITLLSTIKEPGAAVQVARALLQPLLVLMIIMIVALLLHEWLPDL